MESIDLDYEAAVHVCNSAGIDVSTIAIHKKATEEKGTDRSHPQEADQGIKQPGDHKIKQTGMFVQ